MNKPKHVCSFTAQNRRFPFSSLLLLPQQQQLLILAYLSSRVIGLAEQREDE
jgi:hypothetical protein